MNKLLLFGCVAALAASVVAEVDWHGTVDEAKATPHWMIEPAQRAVDTNEVVVADVPRDMKLFLLIGQSNMAGRGALSAEDKKAIPRCVKLNREGVWVEATSPLHFDRPTAGYGVANAFVRCYLEEHPSDTVGLIPCAVGGSSSVTWSPEEASDPIGTNYRWALARARQAQKHGKIVGIFWHQGETDVGRLAKDAAHEDRYVARLAALAAALRRELNCPDAPFLVGEIGTLPRNCTAMNPVLSAAAKGIPNGKLVKASDLTGHQPDGIHFDTPSYKVFGARYYAAWKSCVAALAASVASAVDVKSEEGGIAIPPKPASSDGQIVVFENEATGKISPQNGVCGAPDKPGTANFAAWKAAAFPYSRTHDLNLCATYGAPYVIDVPWIFRDFDADENDPKSYDFACTDDILRRIREAGVEPFYRLGGAYESYLVKHYNVFPPKDFAKWARVCEHIIAHYTEGWADGYTWKMGHWEIWNEPDLATGPGGKMNRFWIGGRDQFKELWKTALKHLKSRFPHLKFGGAAFAGTGGDWGKAMVKEFAAEKVPLDFYSWHCYTTDPASYGRGAKWVRQMLDSHGYTNTLSVIDEWNYVKGWDVHALGGYSRNVWLGDKNDKCAAFIAASMIELDAAGVDIGMFYDARKPGMNALFDSISGQPMRGYYPFIAWRNLRRLGMRIKTTSEFKNGVWTVAAKGADGKIGILVARYTDDDNAFRPKRVTLRLASGKSLKNAVCHLTDRNFIYTAYDSEPNADGSIDLTMAPCSFAYVDVAP